MALLDDPPHIGPERSCVCTVASLLRAVSHGKEIQPPSQYRVVCARYVEETPYPELGVTTDSNAIGVDMPASALVARCPESLALHFSGVTFSGPNGCN